MLTDIKRFYCDKFFSQILQTYLNSLQLMQNFLDTSYVIIGGKTLTLANKLAIA